MAIMNSEIAQRLKGIRLLSDVSVAEMAKVTGVTEEEYLKLENNETPLSVSILLDACAYLNISMTELLTGERARLHTYSFVKNGRGLSVDRSKAYKYEKILKTVDIYSFVGFIIKNKRVILKTKLMPVESIEML